VNRAPFSNAVALALEAGLAGQAEGGQDILVGRDRPPARGNLQYVILYSMPGGDWIGPPVNPEADGALMYQVKAVAKRSTTKDADLGAEAIGDLVRPIMLGISGTVGGLTVMRALSLGVGGNDADDRVMNFDERFVYLVTS
jgi:hypothetical protein